MIHLFLFFLVGSREQSQKPKRLSPYLQHFDETVTKITQNIEDTQGEEEEEEEEQEL